MAGKKCSKLIISELFDFAQDVMKTYRIYPYVSFIVKDEVIVARGYNMERETRDVTMQCSIVAIRQAQEALDTGDLSGYSLYSFFEPTILGFDVALWAGIRDFIWCINSASLPKHYNKIRYTPLNYMKYHPGEITILNELKEKEALKLVSMAKTKKYYPDNLL